MYAATKERRKKFAVRDRNRDASAPEWVKATQAPRKGEEMYGLSELLDVIAALILFVKPDV